MPLASLLYPPDAFEKRSIDLRCRYVAVYASEKTTAKSVVRHQRRQWRLDMASRPCRLRVTRGNTSRRKGWRICEWRSSDPARQGQIHREERRRRQLRSLNVTRDSPRRRPLSGLDLSGTDRQQAVLNCVADMKRFVCNSLR